MMASTTTTSSSVPHDRRQEEDEDDSVDSADEALCELLGLSSLKALPTSSAHEDEPPRKESVNDLTATSIPDEYIQSIVIEKYSLHDIYKNASVVVFPTELSIPAALLRRLTEDLVWGGDNNTSPIHRTYETVVPVGSNKGRRTLTRLENFVNSHTGWHDVCHDYLRRCISALLGEPHVLYKEKLNLKPAAGNGFAPHLDTPSLRVAGVGPQNFVTVMVAIDTMTVENGCLRVAKGAWSEDTAVRVNEPDADGNPDAGGRAGAIPPDISDQLEFEDLICKGGTIVAFNGWVPHRSGVNQSAFARRAVFLTYNPASEGDFHDAYYAKMEQLRTDFRRNVGLVTPDEQSELDALATIPRV
jgi:ectoine hydroxylase-related dioxygenase (phytanoyl-CoA dioxygenase family)